MGCGQLGYNTEGLKGQLAGRGDDDRARALTLLPLQAGEELDSGKDEGEGLA